MVFTGLISILATPPTAVISALSQGVLVCECHIIVDFGVKDVSQGALVPVCPAVSDIMKHDSVSSTSSPLLALLKVSLL